MSINLFKNNKENKTTFDSMAEKLELFLITVLILCILIKAFYPVIALIFFLIISDDSEISFEATIEKEEEENVNNEHI